MPRVTASIPVELGAALEERARAEDRSASAVVRRALVEHLEVFPSLVGSRVPTESRTPQGAVAARARRDIAEGSR
jgi:hypothetical protein